MTPSNSAIADALREIGLYLEMQGVPFKPHRLDLKDDQIRRAIAAGVKLVIDSDAHGVNELGFPEEYGISQARRGWATRNDVLNTLPADRFLDALK